jgi:hypothetical protein
MPFDPVAWGKDAMKLIAAGETIPLKEQVIEGQQELLALTKRAWDLEHEVMALKEALALRARVAFHQDGTITLKDEDPSIYYCANCYATRGILNPPSRRPHANGLWCTACSHALYPPGYETGEGGPE